MSKAIRRNLLELNATFVFRAVARLVGTIVLVDRLGLDGYGQLSYALTLSLTFVILGDFGIVSYAVRSVARDRSWYRENASRIFVLGLVVGATRYAAVAVALPWVCPSEDLRHLTLLFCLGVVPAVLNPSWCHFAHDRTSYLRNGNLLNEGAWLAGVLFVVNDVSDLPRLVWIFVGSRSIEALYQFATVRRYEGSLRLTIGLPPLKEVFGASLPLWLAQSVQGWRAQLGTVVLGYFYGNVAVSIYGLAWTISYNLWMIGTQSAMAVTPTIMRVARSAPSELDVVLRRAARVLCAIGLPAVALLAALAEPVAMLVFGAKGASVGSPMRLLAIMTLPLILRGLVNDTLFALGRSRAVAIHCFFALLTFPLAAAGARYFGAEGLAAVGAIAELTMLAVACSALEQNLAGAVASALARYALPACLAAGVSLLALTIGLIPAAIAGVVTYAGALLAVRDSVALEAVSFARRLLPLRG